MLQCNIYNVSNCSNIFTVFFEHFGLDNLTKQHSENT